MNGGIKMTSAYIEFLKAKPSDVALKRTVTFKEKVIFIQVNALDCTACATVEYFGKLEFKNNRLTGWPSNSLGS